MTANLRLSGGLKDFTGGKDSFEVQSGVSIRQTLIGIGIVPEVVALVVVNEQHQTKDYVIQDGDSIRILAVIGGG